MIRVPETLKNDERVVGAELWTRTSWPSPSLSCY